MVTTVSAMLFQAPTANSSLGAAADVAMIVIAVAIVVSASLGGILFVQLRRVLSEIRRSARQNFGPVSDRARSISDNLEFVTQALRTDVEKLNASVRSLSERLQQASDRMEERIEEFNALMEVVQDEAEDIFLDTASTVRGVREGARTITGSTDREQVRNLRRAAGAHPRGPVEEGADLEGPDEVERSASASPGEKAFPAGEA